MSAKILVVDDERVLVETIAYNLQKEGFEILTAYDGDAALSIARREKPQLIVLDLMLPKISGWEVCRALRSDTEYSFTAPILMLTARGEESDKVIGLEMGADDYLVKPFGMRELVARVRSLLRRAANNQSAKDETAGGEVLSSGNLQLDIARHEAHIDDGDGKRREVKLSFKEFELLRQLMAHKGKTVAREVLLERVWGDDFYGDERTLDVHIRWLREKIEPDASKPLSILTVRGVGYKFKS